MLLREVVAGRAARQPDTTAYVFLDEDGEERTTLTYGRLHARALAVAHRLSTLCRPGDRALLLFPQNADFVVAYLGCLYAGVVAVPVNPPRRNRVQSATLGIVADCEPAAVLTVAAMLDGAKSVVEPRCGALHWVAVDELPDTGGFEPRPCGPDDLAFLQYTSGSTSDPRGVLVSHGNLAANQEMIRHAFGHDEGSTVVGWAPFFHDQGLIGNVVAPLWVGTTSIQMSAMTFVRRPLLWLSVISRYRAHTSGGPNFAFDACVARAARGDLPDVDLSSWKVAFNGAEPIRPETMRRFAETFAPVGFDPGALHPCYGLAEATLIVSGCGKGRGPRTVEADVDALADRRLVASAGGRTLAGSGLVVPGADVRIVDPATGRPCPAGGIGEIRVSGEHVAQGYWRRPEATAETFPVDGEGRAELRTGDLGALVDGELYVVGRIKDLVIVRGRNHYPQDIEHTCAAAHPALRACAAFTVPDGEAEAVVVIAEVGPGGSDAQDVTGSVRAAVMQEHALAVGDVVLTRPGRLPTTSSGKIMRAAARARYLREGAAAWTS